MALPRPVLALVGAGAAMSVLVSCASTIAGDGGFEAGSAPTTSSQPTETTETTTETTTTAAPTTGLTAAEQAACDTIPISDVSAFQAFNDLADMPEENQTPEARMAVADAFSAAIATVDSLIAELPEGPIKDTSVDYRAAQVEVRDKLNTGDDVSTQIILDAQVPLDAACGN